MRKPVINDLLKWLPLISLVAVHAWLFRSCVAGHSPPGPAGGCINPPLSALGLLGLSFIELTRGSRTRGAIALVAVAIPLALQILGDVIN